MLGACMSLLSQPYCSHSAIKNRTYIWREKYIFFGKFIIRRGITHQILILDPRQVAAKSFYIQFYTAPMKITKCDTNNITAMMNIQIYMAAIVAAPNVKPPLITFPRTCYHIFLSVYFLIICNAPYPLSELCYVWKSWCWKEHFIYMTLIFPIFKIGALLSNTHGNYSNPYNHGVMHEVNIENAKFNYCK